MRSTKGHDAFTEQEGYGHYGYLPRRSVRYLLAPVSSSSRRHLQRQVTRAPSGYLDTEVCNVTLRALFVRGRFLCGRGFLDTELHIDAVLEPKESQSYVYDPVDLGLTK
jgi:hypothetical protein